MSWVHVVALGAGLASMRAAIERGDLDEAARQGALAGPVVIEQALAAPDRATRLAGIAAAPSATDRAELLDALARVARGPDRRTAIPAARAARDIARALAPTLARPDLPDHLAPADLVEWGATWAELAARRDRWIELRVLALDTAATLDPAAAAAGLAAALADPDPAYRRAAIAALPAPVPATARDALAAARERDPDPAVAREAAAILCADLGQHCRTKR